MGFLTYDVSVTGSGRVPPPCDVYIQLGGMPNSERVCLFYCTRGYYCARGDRCLKAHVSGFTRLPGGTQQQFRAFVERTPGLAFAPGQGPPGAV